MWNKICLIFLFFMACFVVDAQNFLGKTKMEIEQFIKDNQAVAIDVQRNDSSIVFRYEEEDERNRMFEATCKFILDKGRCSSYEKVVVIHEYWAKSIQDLVSLKKAKGSGDIIAVDGENLFSLYAFDEGFFLKLILKEEYLIQKFEYISQQ